MGVVGVNHLTLSSADVEAACTFYVEVLGFAVVARWPSGRYLSAGDVWLALVAGPRESRGDDYSHIAFHVESHDFEAVASRIRDSGAALWQDNWTEGDSLYFTDPDGHRLEIHSTTLAQRLASARAEPWDGLELLG